MIRRGLNVAALMFVAVIAWTGCSYPSDKAAAAHAAAAKANHERRLAWQKAHPKEWAAQQAAARAAADKRADELQAQRVAREKQAVVDRAYAAEHTPCKEFGRGLDSIDGIGQIVAGDDCTSVAGGALIHVTIRDQAWQTFDYDERLRLAKSLWASCVKYVHPQQADTCHVRLRGEAGEDLGGSNDFAGSLIDVSKD